MSSNTLQISYIGLGAIGKHMSGHIANHAASLNYPPLLAYNRTQAKAEELKKTHPVVVATSLEEVAKKSDVIFSCLLNDAAVQETVEALLPHMKPNTILVEQSTIAPKLVKELAQKVSQAGGTYMACPIMGPPLKAAAADLIVLVAGGDSSARSKVLPLMIPVIGKKKIELGENPEESSRLKLCGNFIVTSVVEMLGEYMTLAEASGVGQDKAQELIDNFLPQTMISTYASRISNETFRDQIHFSINSIKKDANHIIDLANEANAPVPITHTFLKNCDYVLEKHGDYDLTGVVTAHRDQAGIPADLQKK
ncbi:hypothetical protein G6F57_004421 [Rhizopus arrhizus]|uniref:Uncharacterized protein n=1 Tax=Rhizopus oryzae TaxID=64495 RepID=A0A9P6X8G0_RHIOR|nr:hypothetical protein G6F23_006435 [Rhizopus arrhizus]KAG1412884.1 hypothetical protein G6F58_007784 [Rhizopus delemar]KAG0765819.1 hypothetical protein G6F24_004112 [Rhizopus arrhizus]KAG0784178.1 hypothetical protein G6F21_010071 [Rhizopus arrhizus]KAG0813985.1 hypothetical protein G6F20_005134 [Rhizopus arrhizus]